MKCENRWDEGGPRRDEYTDRWLLGLDDLEVFLKHGKWKHQRQSLIVRVEICGLTLQVTTV